MKRTRIKICGLTSKEQAVEISLMDVDALGFILYPPSPRYIESEKLTDIIKHLPPFTKSVGIFVNESQENVVSIVRKTGIDLVQLSGDESPEYCNALSDQGIQWIKGLRVKDSTDLENLKHYSSDYFLLDAWSDKEFGGTGKTFDWNLIHKQDKEKKLVLAGGINEKNVQEAIRKVKPYALDVSSGVEISPGNKSIEKVKNLLKQVSLANQPV